MNLYKASRMVMGVGLLIPFQLFAQKSRQYIGELKDVIEAVKNSRNLSYRYSFKAEFPDGEKDAMKGEVYTGNVDRLLYNSSEAFTMLYTNKWFYKADHRARTVTIVNLEKHLSKDYKKDLERDIFENNTVSIYLDSVIFRNASVRKLRKSGDTVFMNLGFAENHPVKSMDITYNDKEKALVSYSFKTYQEIKSYEYKKHAGISRTIACSDFHKVEKNNKYRTDNFFIVKNDKAVLKKYGSYKLNTQL